MSKTTKTTKKDKKWLCEQLKDNAVIGRDARIDFSKYDIWVDLSIAMILIQSLGQPHKGIDWLRDDIRYHEHDGLSLKSGDYDDALFISKDDLNGFLDQMDEVYGVSVKDKNWLIYQIEWLSMSSFLARTLYKAPTVFINVKSLNAIVKCLGHDHLDDGFGAIPESGICDKDWLLGQLVFAEATRVYETKPHLDYTQEEHDNALVIEKSKLIQLITNLEKITEHEYTRIFN